MATVNGLTKDRMLAIEAASVVDGFIEPGGHLILVQQDGTQIDAGPVAGANVMGPGDSASIDMSVTGSGTPAAPWVVSGTVKNLPASTIDSGVFNRDRIPSLTVTGTLHPTYRDTGPAQVKIDGDSTYTTVYWHARYLPWGSRRVSLTKFGNSWVITGQLSYEDPTVTIGHRTIPLTLGPNWRTYNASVADTDWAEPRATQLPSGLVVLSGLLRFQAGIPAPGAVVASGLPVGMRPEYTEIHPVSNSDQARVIDITPAGNIVVRGGWISNGYVSLDGVAFWPVGTATWTNVGSGGSSFNSAVAENTPGDAATWGPTGFYKDPYGFVWFRGLVRLKVAVSADNTVLINLPATHRVNAEQHLRACGQDTYAGVGGQPGNGLNWKPNSPNGAGQWISLYGVVFTTSDAISLNDWINFSGFASSWAVHGGAWPYPATLRRGDGLCMTKGLLSGGSYGPARAAVMPREMWPDMGRLLIDGIGNNLRSRWDISGVGENDITNNRKPGGISPINGGGVAGWVSLDGLKWVTTSL